MSTAMSAEDLTHQGQDRRQSLILAAYHSIAEKGFEGLRVREVAAQVGINPATLHHYFPTKEALIQAVVEYVIERLAATGSSLEGTPVEQLRAQLAVLYRQMRQEPALFAVLTEIRLRAQRHTAIHHFVQQQEAFWHTQLVSLLQAGVRQGQWPEELDTEAVASAIITFIEGASLGVLSEPKRVEQAIVQLEGWLISR
jgi:AcrR family transcriptional regulator